MNGKWKDFETLMEKPSTTSKWDGLNKLLFIIIIDKGMYSNNG